MFPILKTIISSLFKKSMIEKYPIESRIKDPIYRGQVKIEIDKCIFCGICQRKCPAEAIEVTKAETTWAIDRFRCVQCSSCVDSCPKKCLTMSNTLPATSEKMVKDVVTLARVSDNYANNSNS